MKNITSSIIKGLNNITTVEVVDRWCYTITVMVKAVTFFDILPKNIQWDIKNSDRFLKESLNNKFVFVVLDIEKSLKPQYLVITDGEYETEVLDIHNKLVDEDEFYKNVGYFPDVLSPNKSERDVMFATVNAKRIQELKVIPELRKV